MLDRRTAAGRCSALGVGRPGLCVILIQQKNAPCTEAGPSPCRGFCVLPGQGGNPEQKQPQRPEKRQAACG